MTKSLDGVLTKKANTRETFTEQQIADLKACTDPDTGYLHFCNHFFSIQHPVEGKMLFKPFDYQERLLESYHNHRFNINMLPRQSGKTTTAAGYLLWYAMFHPDQTILIAAHKYTGGRAIITSTPNSDEDTFAVIWKESQNKFDANGNEQKVGINGFHGFTAQWNEHPDRDEEWKTVELGRIGEERFRREYGCEFLVYDETLINSIKLSTMEGSDPLMNMGQTRWYDKIKDTENYVVALDPSMGTGGDYAAIQVFELPAYKQVAEWRHNETPIPAQIRILKDITSYLKQQSGDRDSHIYWSVENNAIGEAALIVIQDFGEENIPGLFISEPIRKGHVRKFRKGFNTTHGSKITACSRLKTMVENDQLKLTSKTLITELKNFVATGTSFRAKIGQTDDLISATLLALRMMSVLKDWDPRIYNTFTQAEGDEIIEPPMPIYVTGGLG